MSLLSLRRTLWVLVAVAALAALWLMLWPNLRDDRAQTGSDPAFYADFELTDHRGMVQQDEYFDGRWMLIFFGFTNCPDICPTTLSEVAYVMESLGEDAADVQPLFITIDPARDTTTALAEYVPLFDANIIGLTGTPEQIARTSETFPIFFERIEEASAPDGYTMGHTSHLFLFDPEAGFANSWPSGTPAEEILADLQNIMEAR